jgi:hypothetical protein
VKGITLYQPWASATAVGLKGYETRAWSSGYRGLLAIHAAKEVPKYIREMQEYGSLCMAVRIAFFDQFSIDTHGPLPGLPTSSIVTLCALGDCLPAGSVAPKEPESRYGDFSPGRWAWRLDHRTKIDPVACSGKQGLWDVPFEIESRILEQVKCLAWPLKFL